MGARVRKGGKKKRIVKRDRLGRGRQRETVLVQTSISPFPSSLVAGAKPHGYTGSVCQAKRPNPTIFLLFVGLSGKAFPSHNLFFNTAQYDTQ